MGFRRKTNWTDYRAVKKVEMDGRTFGSKAESQVYLMLKAQEQAGEIKDIRCQVHIDLLPRLGQKRMVYIADFVVWDLRMKCDVAVECKGFETEKYLQKKKVYRFTGPMPLRIYKTSWGKIGLEEEIYPDRQKLLDWLGADLTNQPELIPSGS